MNIQQVGGAILSISQFTLYAETRHGNRPSFTAAGNPELASKLYDTFNQQLAASGVTVATGEFGADMQVSLVNDGPVTICYDTDQRWSKSWKTNPVLSAFWLLQLLAGVNEMREFLWDLDGTLLDT